MSGPPNDAKPFIGRVTVQSDGTKTITALPQRELILGRQKRITDLIAAAETYALTPTAEALVALSKAATEL